MRRATREFHTLTLLRVTCRRSPQSNSRCTPYGAHMPMEVGSGRRSRSPQLPDPTAACKISPRTTACPRRCERGARATGLARRHSIRRGVAATQRVCSCLSCLDATRRSRRASRDWLLACRGSIQRGAVVLIAPATLREARDRPARHLPRGARATPIRRTCPISDSVETASALLVHQSRRCSRRLCRRKMLQGPSQGIGCLATRRRA